MRRTTGRRGRGLGHAARIISLLLMLGMPLCGWAQAEVRIEGASEELQRNLRAHLGSVEESTLTKPKTLARRLTEALEEAGKGLGYYQATETHEVNGKQLIVRIEPGPRVQITQSDIRILGEGAQQHWFQSLLENTGLRQSEALNHGHYQNLKKRLRQTAQRYGYFDATFEQQQIIIDRETQSAQVFLVFNTGARYQFGEFNIQGTGLRPAVVRNLAPFESGELYDATKITQFNRNMLESRYFDDVRINIDPEKRKDHRVPIEVSVRDVADHKFGVGLGYGTDTGARFKLTWDRFLVNERGDSFAVATQVAQISQSVTGRYRFAGKKALTDYFEIQSGWQHKAVEDTDTTVSNVGFYVQRQAPSLWTRGLFVKLQNESFTQGDTSGSLTYIIPGISFSRTRSRGLVDPVWGDHVWTDVQYSGPALRSDTSFVRWTGGFKYLRRLEDLHQVQFRGEVGTLRSGNFDQVPASMRFFTGGDQTVRGYDYESISPENENGEATGGRLLQVASAEYSYRILDQWRLATFVDTGRAFDDYDDPYFTGYGLGLRWLSPVGIVSVDLAFPDRGDDSDFKIHFYMGPPL